MPRASSVRVEGEVLGYRYDDYPGFGPHIIHCGRNHWATLLPVSLLLGFSSPTPHLIASVTRRLIYHPLVDHSPDGNEACHVKRRRIEGVIELLHELKLELVAEMDYASLEQVEAIIDKVYLMTESSD